MDPLGVTERTIFEQFPLWRAALTPILPISAQPVVTAFIGCGTSYNLAVSLAASLNASGRRAIAAPSGEWLERPAAYWSDWKNVQVVALSRSGETTETLQAVKASHQAKLPVTVVTCERDSALAQNCDRLVHANTHPAEGIVMTTSASLMLLLGLGLLKQSVTAAVVDKAESVLREFDDALPPSMLERSHFVCLGGGPLYGIALEGALKLQEMTQRFSQAYHPLEYRHGPVSLLDSRTLVVMLYSTETSTQEAQLVAELSAKGALVVGFGGPGDLSIPLKEFDDELRGLMCLPALQLLGERIAQFGNVDTTLPRNLTKVVRLG